MNLIDKLLILLNKDRPFKYWKIRSYVIESFTGGNKLWTGNGIEGLEDYDCKRYKVSLLEEQVGEYIEKSLPLVSIMNDEEKKILWEGILREVDIRYYKNGKKRDKLLGLK
jgi:hypothetical protein